MLWLSFFPLYQHRLACGMCPWDLNITSFPFLGLYSHSLTDLISWTIHFLSSDAPNNHSTRWSMLLISIVTLVSPYQIYYFPPHLSCYVNLINFFISQFWCRVFYLKSLTLFLTIEVAWPGLLSASSIFCFNQISYFVEVHGEELFRQSFQQFCICSI